MNYNNVRTSIDQKIEQRDKLLSELDSSMAIQELIPNVFKMPNIRSQWSDECIATYTSKRLRPERRQLAKFRIYSGDTLLATFSYDQVPEVLRVFNVVKQR